MSVAGDGVTLDATGPEAVRGPFANQVRFCLANQAPITARVVSALAQAVDNGRSNAFLDAIRGWTGAPLADALPLRCAGGLHALHLSGREPALAPLYRGQPADEVALIAAAVERHAAWLLPWLDGPPQTNEAARSAGFVAAMAWLAARGLPPRFQCLEIGSSAGINLMIDRYAYDLGGAKFGPGQPPVMAFAPEWRGPPPPGSGIEIVRLKGCDIAPVDLADPAQALRLKAYIWPEHRVRFARLGAATAAAAERPPDVVRMSAAGFVTAELARPQAEGTTRLLMHSIVWQYLAEDEKAQVAAAMVQSGRRASPGRALAWVALEANRTLAQHELVVRFWPGGGEPVLLGRAHPHGAWLAWFAAPRPL